MDAQFEAELLGMIDEFLVSRPTFEDFLSFDREFHSYRIRREDEVLGDLGPAFDRLSLRDLADREHPILLEVYRRLDEQLSQERQQFFLLVAERAAWTAEHVSPYERSAGLGTLDDFLVVVTGEREAYRQRWGV